MKELNPPSVPPSEQPTPIEQPTPAARIRIIVQPADLEEPTHLARIRLSSQPIGFTVEDIPPREAHTLITTLGMIALGLAGITGADLVERAAPSPVLGWLLALAELAVTLVIVLQIARRDRTTPPRD